MDSKEKQAVVSLVRAVYHLFWLVGDMKAIEMVDHPEVFNPDVGPQSAYILKRLRNAAEYADKFLKEK